MPYYLCNDDVIYGGCLPTDETAASDINFSGNPISTISQDATEPSVCETDGTRTLNFDITGTANPYTVTITTVSGTITASADDGAGNIAISQTDPDVNDTGAIASGSADFFDANNCLIGTVTLPDYDAFTNCAFFACPT